MIGALPRAMSMDGMFAIIGMLHTPHHQSASVSHGRDGNKPARLGEEHLPRPATHRSLRQNARFSSRRCPGHGCESNKPLFVYGLIQRDSRIADSHRRPGKTKQRGRAFRSSGRDLVRR